MHVLWVICYLMYLCMGEETQPQVLNHEWEYSHQYVIISILLDLF